MSTVLGLWHLILEGGQEKTINTPTNVQITNVSFGEEVVDQGRTVVKLTFPSLGIGEDSDDEETAAERSDDEVLDTTVLCALTPGKIEHATINLTLDTASVFTFQATGKNKVYLTGNYIRQMDDQGSEMSFGSEVSEDAHYLDDVSSDVEMHPDDLEDLESDASRFEEVDEDQPKASKRPRETDVAADSATADKKANKKLKAEGGKVVSAAAETDDPPKVEKKDKKKKDKKAGSEEKDKKPAPEGTDKKAEKPSAKKTLPSGLVIEDARIGTGPMAKNGSTLRMRYIGKLNNGYVFDKNTGGKPFTFHLGKKEVIQGWEEGIVGMQVGGERLLTIPPKLGYGSRKQEGIPPNSTLHFEVKVLEIK